MKLKNILTKVALLGINAALLSSCSPRKFNNNSNTTHTANKTGVAPDSSYWAQLSEKELNNLVFNINSVFSMIPVQKTENNLSFYLQEISDTIYDSLKNNLQGRARAKFIAPKPKVYVVLDSNFNAFVARQKIRFPLKTNYLPPQMENRKAQIEADKKNGQFSELMLSVGNDYNDEINLTESFMAPGAIPLGASEQLDIILTRENKYLQTKESNCFYTSWSKGEGTINPDCGSLLVANWFSAEQIVPAIFVHVGLLLNDADFSAIVATMAHEMGHYLMAHGIRGANYDRTSNVYNGEYRYFYNEAEYLSTGEPKPLTADLAEQAEQALSNAEISLPEPMTGEFNSVYGLYSLALGDLYRFVSLEKDAKQMRLNSETLGGRPGFWPTTSAFLDYQCRKILEDKTACEEFSQIAKKINTVAIKSRGKGPSSEHIALLPEYSKALQKFAGKIKLAKFSNSGADYSCKITLDSPNICIKALLDTQMFEGNSSAEYITQSVGRTLAKQNEPTLLDWLTTIKQESDKHWNNYLQAINFLNSNNVGWYSTEQQADDISLEALASLGLEAKYTFAFMAKLAGITTEAELSPDKYVNKGGYPLAKSCQELEQMGFKDANGKLLKMRNLDWTDEHHNLCYRVFNMRRESELHKYKVKPISTKFSELQAKFAIITQEAQKIVEKNKVSIPSKP